MVVSNFFNERVIGRLTRGEHDGHNHRICPNLVQKVAFSVSRIRPFGSTFRNIKRVNDLQPRR